MSVINGVWHNALMDPPKTQDPVLAIKQLKNGKKDICIAYCIRNYRWRNPATGVWINEDKWVCQGNNNIIFWMPLPKMPEVEE